MKEIRKLPMPLADISMDIRGFQRSEDNSSGSFELVFTTGAPVVRYDWNHNRFYREVLEVDSGSIDLSRLRAGAPLLNSHMAYSLEDQIGVVEDPVIERGQGTVKAKLSRRESVKGIAQDVADGIIRNVSVGYARNQVEMIPPKNEKDQWEYRVKRWTPMEVSLVPIPADPNSQVRNGNDKPEWIEKRSFECEVVTLMPTAGTAEEKRSKPEMEVNKTEDAQAVRDAEIKRSSEIITLCARHGYADKAADFIRDGKSTEQVGKMLLDMIAEKDETRNQVNVTRVKTINDEFETRMKGIQGAIEHKIDSRNKLDDNAKQYRGLSMIEIGKEYLRGAGIDVTGKTPHDISGMMLERRAFGGHTTSDFSFLMSNVANRRLRSAYEQNPSTYREWAKRAPNLSNFKPAVVGILSGAPELLLVNEHAEIRSGSMSDASETYQLSTYARMVTFSRQSIINDDLRSFDRLASAFGDAAARLENRLVYEQLINNGNLSDGGALFNSNALTATGGHDNLLTGASSALSETSLTTARAKMRLQKGLQGEVLNLSPAILLVPVALELPAFKLTSSSYVPNAQSAISEFRAGGRASVTVISDPLLDASSATAFYLLANSGSVDTVEYAYLDGAEGPVIESEIGFDVLGVSYVARLDFAAKAIDFRGLLKSNGV